MIDFKLLYFKTWLLFSRCVKYTSMHGFEITTQGITEPKTQTDTFTVLNSL